jgi:hypothetical protein
MAIEQFANAPTPGNATTPWATLTASLTNAVTTIPFSTVAPFPATPQWRFLIGNELCLATGIAGLNVTATRGIEGTFASAHQAGDGIYLILTAASLLAMPGAKTTSGDLEYLNSSLQPTRLAAPADGTYAITWTGAVPSYTQGAARVPTALSVNGAIPPHTPAVYVITKAGVLADTLAAPTAGTDDGVIIRIASSTANAHTVTATGLLQTGSAFVNVATFNAQAGASLELMAYNAKWIVLSANGISFS